MDYIIHNNCKTSLEAYQEHLRRNESKVDFKNTVMQVWSRVKKDNHKPSLNDMVDQMMKKKRDEAKNQGDQAEMEKQKKEKAERKRKRKEDFE